MSIEAVLKIGGSISRGTGLPALCREIGRLSQRHPLLVVPGGGDFAEQVRTVDKRFGLAPTAAHNMALLAMDQYGYLLNQLIGGGILTADLEDSCNAAEAGMPAVLLPSRLLIEQNPLPHTWQVTSDSIAAWLSMRIDCPTLVLLKDVDGLQSGCNIITEMTVRQLAAHQGGVDEHLSAILNGSPLETWFINGRHPERLSELLTSGRTLGTRIIST